MKRLQLKIECLILSFYIIDTLYSYFDIVQLLWHSCIVFDIFLLEMFKHIKKKHYENLYTFMIILTLD